MGRKEFEDIHDLMELKTYLENRGKRHTKYYHYTNIQSLKRILDSGVFHLSLASNMNDLQELTKGAQYIWDRTYIASFAFGAAESIAMWGLYGIPRRDAIRIEIPRKTMVEILEATKRLAGVDNAILTDVVYAQGNKNSLKGALRHHDGFIPIMKAPKLVNASTTAEMTGQIKNIAWQYENEVRLRCTLDEFRGQDRITIPLPANFANDISIMTGPWQDFSDNHFYDLLQRCRAYNISEQNINTSIFLKMIKMRDQCDYCSKKPFEKSV